MKKGCVCILLSLATILNATDVSSTISDINAFGISKNRLGIKFSYDTINDSIDLLNIKERENEDIKNKRVSMGDANGYDFSIGYGLTSNISFYYNLNYLNVNYIDDHLKNSQHDIYVKLKFYDNPNYIFDAFTLDLGIIRNSGDNLDIKNTTTVNSMFEKLRPNSNFNVTNNTLQYDDKKINDISTSLKMSDLSDNSLYFRFILGTKIKRHLFNIHLGFKYSDISSSISLEPSSDPRLADAIDKFGDSSINRKEKSLFTGIGYIGEWGNYITETNYEYIRIFDRENGLNDYNSNHIINASLARAINENLLIFIGAKMMFNQFNGVIPYLYNKFSQSKYDKNYGYARVGFVYNFNLFDKETHSYDTINEPSYYPDNEIEYIDATTRNSDRNSEEPIIYESVEQLKKESIPNESIKPSTTYEAITPMEQTPVQVQKEPIIFQTVKELKDSIPNEIIEQPQNIQNTSPQGDRVLEQRVCSPIMPCD